MKKAINYNLINIAIILIIIFFLYQTKDIWFLIFNKINSLLKPFIVSFAIAYLLQPIVKIFKKKFSSPVATSIAIILIVSSLLILLKITLPIVMKESLNLIRQMEYFVNSVDLNTNTSGFLFLESIANKLINNLYLYVENGLVGLFTKSFNFGLQIIIIVVLIVYFLYNYDSVVHFVKNKTKKYKIYSYIKNINKDLSSYIIGIGMIMLIEVFEYIIIYGLIGHPNFLLLAFLASITTIIPFFGGLFTNLVALITASVISKKLFFLTAIVVIFMPIIDSYLIQPRIYKKTNKISPIITIIVVVIGGILYKSLGIMLAVPSYIIIRSILRDIKNSKKNIANSIF